KCFCRTCGAHLFSRNPDDRTQMSIRLAAFDGDPGLRPQWRAFTNYAAPWEPIPDDGLRRYPEARPR
ncbi:MAG TPA: GFA family protein, partial [Solirubrobacteraceae bacterium]|nr:GFA family protein [Solirubrobacteraceae bacterium]